MDRLEGYFTGNDHPSDAEVTRAFWFACHGGCDRQPSSCGSDLTHPSRLLLGWLEGLRPGVRSRSSRRARGHGRVELSTFHTPVATSIAPRAPMNTPGIPRLTFVVDAVDDVLDRLRAHGAELVGEVAQYGDIYRYCYVRGPDGIIMGQVEELR